MTLDAQAGLGFGFLNQAQDGLVTVQRLACPMFADLAEETMLDGIPFGSAGGEVAHGHLQIKAIGDLLLEGPFPGAHPRPVAAAAVGQNEQLGDVRIVPAPAMAPPPGDIACGKFGRVMRGADENRSSVGHHIINPIRNGHALSLRAEVMILDGGRFQAPHAAGILEVAD